MRKKPEKRRKLSDQLREIIETWPESRYRIAQETGISESMLSHFMAKRRGLSQEALDTLGAYLDLEIRVRPKPAK